MEIMKNYIYKILNIKLKLYLLLLYNKLIIII